MNAETITVTNGTTLGLTFSTEAHITELLGEPEMTPEQLRLAEVAKQNAAKKRARKAEKWKAFVESRDGVVLYVD